MDIRAQSYGCLDGIETSKCPAKASIQSATGFHSTSCLNLALLAIRGSHRYDTYRTLRSSNPLLKCHRTEPLYPHAGCSLKIINCQFAIYAKNIYDHCFINIWFDETGNYIVFIIVASTDSKSFGNMRRFV